MASSYLNIISFLFTTLFYYLVLKPKLSYDDMANPDKYKKYLNNEKLYLAVYLFAILIVQFMANSYVITQACGGSIKENIGAAGSLTFVPWILLFGIIIVVLLIFPGFKSAFSDVVGYFYVAGSANKLLTELLVNEKVNDQIEKATSGENTPQQPVLPIAPVEKPIIKTPAAPQGNVRLVGGTSKKELEKAADLIVKICGNTSILINQIVPSNFTEYWNILRPLMKSQYQTDGPLTDEKRNELFELVVTRDNVGEAMWYIYTGFLISSIVQLKITTRGCVVNPEQMAKNYQNYVKQQAKSDKKQEKATNSVYTITN
jgi:hypothetical protein